MSLSTAEIQISILSAASLILWIAHQILQRRNNPTQLNITPIIRPNPHERAHDILAALQHQIDQVDLAEHRHDICAQHAKYLRDQLKTHVSFYEAVVRHEKCPDPTQPEHPRPTAPPH